MYGKSLSPAENPVFSIVLWSNVACAYAYMRSFADLFFSAFGAEGFSGQDSDEWSVFEWRCLAFNTYLLETISFMIIIGFRKEVP